MLNKKEFDVLTALVSQPNLSQRGISARTGYSLGTVNKTLKIVVEKGWTDGKTVTEKGLQELEPYKVKRAVFLAAGFGSRMVPITLNTPKPLVRVNGKRMIETLLDAVQKAGIEEVIIVRGYLGEQFDQLKYKYPNIRFVENPIYNESNNISSAYAVRDLFKNAYVLESDLILRNEALVRKYEYGSNFLGAPVKRTDDWCFFVQNGVICEQGVGGTDCHQMIGISYWDEEDGAKLEQDLEEVFNSPGGRERYWEQTVFVHKKENYSIAIRECSLDDVTEVDTFNELKQLDKTYDL
ncbi:MAG: NTP transferase domain-containing protein [Clostridia bacterium]|nr:NTP transferase domain-containing protein [Clostridia bacterium]